MKILSDSVLFAGSWTQLKETRYIDDANVERQWSYVERRNDTGAVVIVPITEGTRSILLIRQLRIPFRCEVVEFPAGLIEPGESPADAARRELLEETGYSGTITKIGPPVSSSAGITTERITMVHMLVGEQPAAEQSLEGSERIEVFRLRHEECAGFLSQAVRDGLLLDAKVYVYLSRIADETG